MADVGDIARTCIRPHHEIDLNFFFLSFFFRRDSSRDVRSEDRPIEVSLRNCFLYAYRGRLEETL